MRKRKSHWPALTYYHPCFDFSESVRAKADNLINIHKVRFIPFLLVEFECIIIIVLSVLLVFSRCFTETLNDQNSTTTSPKFS